MSDLEKLRHYRDQAKRRRAEAAKITSPHAKKAVLLVADAFDRLADEIEQALKRPKAPEG